MSLVVSYNVVNLLWNNSAETVVWGCKQYLRPIALAPTVKSMLFQNFKKTWYSFNSDKSLFGEFYVMID